MTILEASDADESVDTPLDSEEHARFRARVREFLAAHAQPKTAPPDDEDRTEAEELAETKRFQAALADAGLAGITYPVDYGGQGLDKSYQEIYNAESAAFRLPVYPLAISHGMCLPVLDDYGTDEQRARHQARIIRADEIWCQMFSEPGAGSDVASLQMRAERDGDQWVLNGQKVWTSGAHYCDFGLCVARTDPTLPKHQGLSMFIVDLKAPGVEIRPLTQITGDSNFNEVFFTDVAIPANWLVGDLNQGWNVAIAMLMYERFALGAGGVSGGGGSRVGAKRLGALARARGLGDDPVIRDRIADLYIRERLLGFTGMRIRAAAAAGEAPGPVASIAKLATALLGTQAANLAMAIVGASGQAWDADDEAGDDWARAVVGAPAMGIAGGTNEVQRNIVGERVLGLPKEPSVDRGVPFNELLVGTQKP